MPRVLIVDDGLYARHLMRTLAEAQGFEVTEAASGPEALSLLQEACFEVMVLDIMMPGMDGFTVLENLQRHPPAHRPAVVVITAMGRQEVLARAQQLGALAVLHKPFSSKEFRTALERALQAAPQCP